MFLCTACSTSEIIVEFPSLRELDQHIKSGHMTLPKDLDEKLKEPSLENKEKRVMAAKPIKPIKKEIKLIYRYTGNCPDDEGELLTLEMDVDKKHFCIAVCSQCKKQLETREVEKL